MVAECVIHQPHSLISLCEGAEESAAAAGATASKGAAAASEAAAEASTTEEAAAAPEAATEASPREEAAAPALEAAAAASEEAAPAAGEAEAAAAPAKASLASLWGTTLPAPEAPKAPYLRPRMTWSGSVENLIGSCPWFYQRACEVC